MSKVIVQCPAKINLFLAVGPVDHRNYHPIRTIFQAVSVYDTLTIEPASQLSFSTNDPTIPEENTVTKAARLLMEVADFPKVAIHLEKRIPSESGLGGGSSDAAGVIRAARKLMKMRLSDSEHKAITMAIGADVPFFLVGGRAKGEGYGQVLTKMSDPDPVEHYVLAKHSVSCSTPGMYRSLDDKQYDFVDFPAGDTLYNDFERVAPCESLELIERLQVFGAKDAGLSGSGSAVFGRFTDEASAQRAAEALSKECPWVQACRSLTRLESTEDTLTVVD